MCILNAIAEMMLQIYRLAHIRGHRRSQVTVIIIGGEKVGISYPEGWHTMISEEYSDMVLLRNNPLLITSVGTLKDT